ncbi:MAG: hypothetical protein Q4G67_12260 [Actinomycetia bacterium]|nr:hypothetical protein [Actinomycetes bacterium]
MITPAKLVELVGTGTEDQAAEALETITAMVEGYTRGRHVDAVGGYRPGVEKVVTAAAARFLANPAQIAWKEQVGAYSSSRMGGFAGFSLAELAVLNRYRVRAG